MLRYHYVNAGYTMWRVVLLFSQLEDYCEDEDTNPPLHLERCILGQDDQVYLQEPLVRYKTR